MRSTLVLPIVSLAGLALVGCSTSPEAVRSDVAPATEAQRAALLDRVASLKGTWKAASPEGEGTITYSVSSGGSSVREVMFPGEPHEMTNMYHMDGGTLVMTHYCAIGNQPRLRATAQPGNTIDLRFDSVTNHHAGSHMMSGLKIVFVDENHIKEVWSSMQDGRLVEGPVIELTRAN
ncbi:MAG: hypothetical protein AB7G11_09130 [Phycisphaerales bacterium]